MAKQERQTGGQPRHGSTAPGRPQRAGVKPGAQGPAQSAPPPRRKAPGVPGQDAFQNMPKRRPPSHLPGAQPPPPAPPPEPVAREGRRTEPPRRQGGEQEEKRAQKAERERLRRQRRERVSPAKRRKRRRLIAAGLVLALIGAGLFFSFSVLFKIERFTLQGESPYTQEEILQVFGKKPGDNMFGFSAGAAQEEMQQELPYIEKVEVRRSLPGTVIFRVTPAAEAYCLPWEDGWAVLSDKRKVLRLDGAQPEGLTMLFGVTGVSVVPGQPLAAGEAGNGFPYSYEEYQAQHAPPPGPEPPPEPAPAEGEPPPEAPVEGEAPPEDEAAPEEGAAPEGEAPPAETPPAGESQPVESAPPPASEAAESQPEAEPETPAMTDLALLAGLLDEIAKSGLANVTWVDVSDPLALRLRWEDRITVELGARSSLPEKLKFASVLLNDSEKSQITEGDRGVLDLSGYPDTTDRAWLTPE